MKKQSIIAILFSIILFSCTKEKVTDSSYETTTAKMFNPPPVFKLPTYVTLQAVTVHGVIFITFGWEYIPGSVTQDNGHVFINVITSNIKGGGGSPAEGFQPVWHQELTFYSNNINNPNVLVLNVQGTLNYTEAGLLGGALDVTQDIYIIITYDIISKAHTIKVNSTGKHIVKAKVTNGF